MRRISNAFTLVELLVVVTIVVILLAMLSPAMDKAMTSAEIAVCASNLKAFGVGVPQHYMEHRRKLLGAPKWSDDPLNPTQQSAPTHVLPHHPWYRWYVEPANFTLDAIAPYIQGPNTGITSSGEGQSMRQAVYVGKVWYCPSSLDGWVYGGGVHNNGAKNDKGAATMWNDYAYFGLCRTRDAQWATRPDLLVGRDPGGAGILMTDTIYRLTSGGWWFNHSTMGYSISADPASTNSSPRFIGDPPVTGQNQLTADGGVHWKDGTKFNPVDMNQKSLDQPMLTSQAGPNIASQAYFY